MKANEIMMFIDTSKCIGCKGCQVACKQWHKLPAEETEFSGEYTNPPDLSGKNLTVVKFQEVETDDKDKGNLEFLFFKNQCRHCDKPRCKEACPEGVEIDAETGAVIFNEKATKENCRIPLEEACPYNVPRYSEDLGRYVKCDLCYDRFKSSAKGITKRNGKPTTACELTCPTGAIVTGTVKEIIKLAQERLELVKNNGHPNASIYTDYSAGHVIWLLTEPPEKYGLPK